MVFLSGDASDPPSIWSVAIFSARESAEVLLSCIKAVLVACSETTAVVDILVNGNEQLADRIGALDLAELTPPKGCRLRLWCFGTGDKANTWNEYVRNVWPGSATAFFVDGYVRVRPDAFTLLHQALTSGMHALAASGVPTMGGSARRLRHEMIEEGGIHGNLYALRGETVARLRRTGFQIPLGLYRTDPLLAAVLAFNLDPALNDWDWSRIAIVPDATWEYDALDWWRPAHIWTQFKRMVRQGQGSLENAAIKRHLAIEKRPPEQLPYSTHELIVAWMRAFPEEARAVFRRRPLSYLAARRLKAEHPGSPGRGRVRLIRELATHSITASSKVE